MDQPEELKPLISKELSETIKGLMDPEAAPVRTPPVPCIHATRQAQGTGGIHKVSSVQEEEGESDLHDDSSSSDEDNEGENIPPTSQQKAVGKSTVVNTHLQPSPAPQGSHVNDDDDDDDDFTQAPKAPKIRKVLMEDSEDDGDKEEEDVRSPHALFIERALKDYPAWVGPWYLHIFTDRKNTTFQT
jgi:hypothetical protein